MDWMLVGAFPADMISLGVFSLSFFLRFLWLGEFGAVEL